MSYVVGLMIRIYYFYTFFYFNDFTFSYPPVPPQVLPFGFGEETADMGDIASAICVVPKGDLPMDIRWSLNSAAIVHGKNGFSIVRYNVRTSSLNIDSLSSFHRGIFKCIATNKAGSSEYVAELQVNGLLICPFFICC